MSPAALVVHGHFYQPPRLDPFTGRMPLDPTASPARDWNERISADCYRPNAVAGNLAAMSWDVGPTLAGWLDSDDGDRVAYGGFVDGDRGTNGMAQPFHHTILPLASAADRRTEIRWGLRDFELRFGRRPVGMWLPETAVDLDTLRMLAAEGIEHTILAPWQVAGHPDTRRPVRLDLGAGRSIVAAIYDGLLSAAVSFEPAATVDADRFVAERIVPRFAESPADLDGADPLVVIASDGELYGHHQPLREHFLARLVGTTAPSDRPFERPSLTAAIAQASARGLPAGRLQERTSWSCHHGVTRWAASCGCVPDGDWKVPLRIALERLAGGIDALTERLFRELPGAPDPWQTRDDYVDVVIGSRTDVEFAAERLDARAGDEDATTFTAVLHAQRWRLAMFASCAWFWEQPDRPETYGALRSATRAARLIDRVAGSALEARLDADLATIRGPGRRDGGSLLDAALAIVGERRGA
ncbi:MAG TPA: DUF3536 domain-containing protein [Candidatus Limnocylindrales bacterium]|nr:DUF3536 domain-containing protein [Candidatus Limnocylindrales bacterium]